MEKITDKAVKEANDVLKRFGVTPKNDTRGSTSAPPINPSGSGSFSGSGTSGNIGKSGGSDNSSSGGNLPPRNTPSSDGEHSNGGTMRILGMSPRTLMLTIGGFVTSLAIVYLTVWKTSPEGQKLWGNEVALDIAKIELERDKQKTRQIKALIASGMPIPANLLPVPTTAPKPLSAAAVSSNCKVVGDKEGATRLTAVQPSFGQCFTLPGSSTRQLFFLMLNSPPKEITGQASFAHMREELEEDKVGRRARCMAQTGDAEYCEVEMQKRVGVRVDYCLTMDSPDRCISYLKGKTHVPIVVHSDEPVSINMQ